MYVAYSITKIQENIIFHIDHSDHSEISRMESECFSLFIMRSPHYGLIAKSNFKN